MGHHKVYPMQLNRLKRVEKFHYLQSELIFSEAFQTEWREPFGFPTAISHLNGKYP